MDKFEQIFQQQQPKLKYLKHHNKKVIICFSGVAGTGKSQLATAIEKRFRGIRISNDDIRQIIDRLSMAENPDMKQQLLDNYWKQFLLIHLSKESNGLIIRDSSIDRKYDDVKQVADRLGYQMFVIVLKVPRNQIEARIKQRHKSKHNYQAYFDNLDRWFDDNRKLLSRIVPDIEIDNTSQKDWPSLFDAIEQILK